MYGNIIVCRFCKISNKCPVHYKNSLFQIQENKQSKELRFPAGNLPCLVLQAIDGELRYTMTSIVYWKDTNHCSVGTQS